MTPAAQITVAASTCSSPNATPIAAQCVTRLFQADIHAWSGRACSARRDSGSGKLGSERGPASTSVGCRGRPFIYVQVAFPAPDPQSRRISGLDIRSLVLERDRLRALHLLCGFASFQDLVRLPTA